MAPQLFVGQLVLREQPVEILLVALARGRVAIELEDAASERCRDSYDVLMFSVRGAQRDARGRGLRTRAVRCALPCVASVSSSSRSSVEQLRQPLRAETAARSRRRCAPQFGACVAIRRRPLRSRLMTLRRRSESGLPAADELARLHVRQDARQARREQTCGLRERAHLQRTGVRERAQDAPLLFGHAVIAQARGGTGASPLHARAAAPSGSDFENARIGSARATASHCIVGTPSTACRASCA